MPLKVIFSGRLFEAPLEMFTMRGINTVVTLNELPTRAAQLLLQTQGVPPALAAQIAASNLLPKRPLELRLLARLAIDGDLSINALELELRGNSGTSIDAAQAIIYQRVLRRLGPGLIQQLACPGLVLRYVTPELVQHVLAPALDLPAVDAAEAALALERLASHTWLVTRDSRGALWHRRELRRSMLKLMLATQEETARRISTAAVKFFSRQETWNHAEAVYHRLLLVRSPEDGNQFELPELRNANPHIRTDCEDLSAPALALLRFATQKSVPAADILLLPDVYVSQAYDTTGQRLAKLREWGQAVKLIKRRPHDSQDLTPWEVDALFATMQWNRLCAVEPSKAGLRDGLSVLERISQMLYPLEIVAPTTFSPFAFKAWSRYSELNVPSSNLGSMLNRFAVSLVLVNSRESLPPQGRRYIRNVLKAAEASKSKPLSAIIAHRIFLLTLLSKSPTRIRNIEAPFALVLRRSILDAMMERPGLRSLRSLLQSTIDQLYRPSRPLTAKLALSAVDTMYVHHKGRKITYRQPGRQLSKPILALLRGPDADFRDPVRFAILAEFTTPTDYKRLSGLLRSCVDLPLVDLEPDVFAEAMKNDAEHALESYVELIDRSGNLGPLTEALCRERPRSNKLHQLDAALRRWDGAVRALIESRFLGKL